SAAAQITKFDAVTRAAAKKFIKPIPHDELRCEIDLFCELFTRPAVMAALKKFVEDPNPMPYLPCSLWFQIRRMGSHAKANSPRIRALHGSRSSLGPPSLW